MQSVTEEGVRDLRVFKDFKVIKRPIAVFGSFAPLRMTNSVNVRNAGITRCNNKNFPHEKAAKAIPAKRINHE